MSKAKNYYCNHRSSTSNTFYCDTFQLTKHYEVGRLSMHVLLVKGAVKHLEVAATAIDVLFVLYAKLDDQGFPFVAEGLKLGRQAVESCILRKF